VCHKTNWVAATAISNHRGIGLDGSGCGMCTIYIYIDMACGWRYGLDACIYAKSVRWTLDIGIIGWENRNGTQRAGLLDVTVLGSQILEGDGWYRGPQWARPKTKANRTHFWLHWASCVDLWLKELTDKIKYALCPAVAAGDRRVLGGFKWAGQGRWWRKAAVGGWQNQGDQPQIFSSKNASEFIVWDVCMQNKQRKSTVGSTVRHLKVFPGAY